MEEFFLTEGIVVQFLKEKPPEEVQTVLVASANWSGAGWDITKLAKAVRLLTCVAMVTTNFKEYLNSFLFSLALSAGLEIPTLELKTKPRKSPSGFQNAGRQWEKMKFSQPGSKSAVLSKQQMKMKLKLKSSALGRQVGLRTKSL